jgi:hypothetical protein
MARQPNFPKRPIVRSTVHRDMRPSQLRTGNPKAPRRPEFEPDEPEEPEPDEEPEDEPPAEPQPVEPPAEPESPPLAAAAPEHFDSFQDSPVIEDGKFTGLTVPIRKVSPLQLDPGRGMMSTEGANDPVYARYIQDLDMDELRLALAKSNSPNAVKFLSHLANPLFATTDIVTLAKLCSIGLTDMMQIWRNHKLTHAVQVMVDASPTLAAHAVEDAKSGKTCCKRCDGSGRMQIITKEGKHRWPSCVVCDGKGWINQVGDHRARELVFRSVGLVHNEAAMVNVQINNSTHSVTSVLDELERANPAIPVTHSD